MFFRKPKIKKQFDEQLVTLIKSTKEDFEQSKVLAELIDDFDDDLQARVKIAESIHFYLFKEARYRKVLLK
ncbi:MAG: YaaL family protein [Caryophanon sp.]|nr:YaaL family protein [Caryophanon sp.]